MTTSKTDLRPWAARLLLPAVLAFLGGCATVERPMPRDPWEPMNRSVSKFNDHVDSIVLRPVATVYKQQVPPLVRTGVSNFFGNLGDIWSFANSLLQLKVHDAAENFTRFGINTFFGLGGILDVASDLNIERHKEDFGQTLGRWGVPAGPYIVLPFLGPSTLRDALALPVDRRYDAVQRIDPQSARQMTYGLRAVDIRSNLLRVGTVLEEAALDKYSFVRDSHLQRRRAEIFEREADDGNAGQTDEGVPPALPANGAPGAAQAPAGAPAPGQAPAGQPAPAPAR